MLSYLLGALAALPEIMPGCVFRTLQPFANALKRAARCPDRFNEGYDLIADCM